MQAVPSDSRKPPSLPTGVVVLGFVSLLMDLSSEVIHSLLPIFLVSVLGASALAVGVIEGVAEATASFAKLFSGVLSDRFARRKPWILFGYGLAALTKPLFPLAGGAGLVLFARFLDRIGKGIRGAPRDALIADLTDRAQRGAAYGLRQALDTLGAFLAPVAAIALMAATADDVRFVFWVAAVPAFLCVVLIAVGVKEPARPAPAAGSKRPATPRHSLALAQLGRPFWSVVSVAAILTLARFSEAFLLLRAQSLGLANTWVPAVLLVMNGIYALAAYPLGRWSDGGRRQALLLLGIALLAAAHLALALAPNLGVAALGVALWGAHLAATQGLLAAMVADAAPPEARGSAFGVFHLATGMALLLASASAGALWTLGGPSAPFWAGAALAGAAMVLALHWGTVDERK
ncbi:MAG: MFS transporter [Porticoccaceae bacterium]|nr:MAG: MFS transporter [Porticoccaceae bacterium]